MKKLLLAFCIMSPTFSFAQKKVVKDDIKLIEKKGWKIIQTYNTTFSATFIDNFTSSQSSDNWDLYNGEGVSWSTIQDDRLKIKFSDKGRLRVPISEAPMSLLKNNFDIIAIFEVV